MTDILDNPFDPFADAVEAALAGMREEIRSVRGELETLRTETRNAPIIQPPAPVVVEGPAGKDGRDGRDGADGKDGIATEAELDAKIEARFADLKVRTFADSYAGVYKSDTDYTRGTFTTWGGSLFLSKSDTRSKPGESPDWQLVVKRGADGRK